MILNVNIKNLEFNIKKAQRLVNVPVSLMFKEFYEFILPEIDKGILGNHGEVFATNAEGSVCFSIGKYDWHHKGALVINSQDALECLKRNISILYIPVNAEDNREGITVSLANNLASIIKETNVGVSVRAMITSGCLNEKHPTMSQLNEIWSQLNGFDGISLGGSFWLAFRTLPAWVTDVRIGEYMLFGTIPFNNDRTLQGKNGIEIEASVIGVFPERNQFIVDCGYALADMDKCRSLAPFDFKYVDSSSEYTIFEADVTHIKVGDTLSFVPNYKSLVKLRNGEHRFVTS